jgi:tetratricopeptide (TPR) repeat protein
MSIVNEALKKAAETKDKKERQKTPQQEQWVIAITSWNWRKALLLGSTAVLVLGIALWWTLQKLPTQQKAVNVKGGKIFAPEASLIDPPKPSKVELPALNQSDHGQKGLAYYYEHKYKEAEQEFLAILTLDSNQAVVHNNLGLVYHAQGRIQDAIVEYLTALKIEPNFPEAMNNLALSYDQQSRSEEAVSLYDRALRIKPDYSEAHLNYAIILERLGYLGEAKKHYRQFLSQPPSGLRDVVASVQARLPTLPN